MQAKQSQQQLLCEAKIISQRRDAERLNRHGRTLAHLFLPNGTNVQAALLADGLAMPSFIPPGVDYADCYEEVAASARRSGRRLWSMPAYQAILVKNLHGDERGFHVIRDKARYLSDSRSAAWLNLENNVALRITRPDLPYFFRGFF